MPAPVNSVCALVVLLSLALQFSSEDWLPTLMPPEEELALLLALAVQLINAQLLEAEMPQEALADALQFMKVQ
jgi:hypothetical protein